MLLATEGDVEIIGEAGTAAEALAAAADLEPDVILMDIGLPDKPRKRSRRVFLM